jgi:hypothetical protein
VTTIAHPADVAALLERLDELEMWQRREHAAWREGFRRGRAVGIEEGRAEEAAEQLELHRAMAARILHGEPFTELQRRR